jgi:ABC-2 type transport system ATP-binding protein
VERVLEALTVVAAGPPRVDRAVGRVSVPVDGGSRDLVTATRALEDRAIDIADIGLRRPTLDEVFLTLTGKGIDNDPASDHEAA